MSFSYRSESVIVINSVESEMSLKLFVNSVLLCITCVHCRTYLVSNSRQLKEYLRVVSPGDTIQLRDGFYSGTFVANRIARANAPIRVVGSRRAIFSNPRGTALYVTGQYWWLRGFTVTNSRRGIAVQNGKHNLLERITVRNMEEDGIALRQDSDDNTIRDCSISRTGLRLPQYGFGVTIGSDERQSYRGYVDRSDSNSIVNSRFQTSTAAEAIHAYEGTCCGTIRDNFFDGRPITGNGLQNRCWVTISGNNYRISNNEGRSTAMDGFRVRMSEGYDVTDNGGSGGQTGGQGGEGGGGGGGEDKARDSPNSQDYDYEDIEIQGCGNQFRGNTCNMNSNGYCIRVINPNLCRVSVYVDNRVTGGATLTNVGLRNL